MHLRLVVLMRKVRRRVECLAAVSVNVPSVLHAVCILHNECGRYLHILSHEVQAVSVQAA
jgi:hypothetical protein